MFNACSFSQQLQREALKLLESTSHILSGSCTQILPPLVSLFSNRSIVAAPHYRANVFQAMLERSCALPKPHLHSQIHKLILKIVVLISRQILKRTQLTFFLLCNSPSNMFTLHFKHHLNKTKRIQFISCGKILKTLCLER